MRCLYHDLFPVYDPYSLFCFYHLWIILLFRISVHLIHLDLCLDFDSVLDHPLIWKSLCLLCMTLDCHYVRVGNVV